jgi:ribosomal protein S17E
MGTTPSKKVRMIVRELLKNCKEMFEGKTYDEIKKMLDEIFKKEKEKGIFTKKMRNVLAGKIVRTLKRMKRKEIKEKALQKTR